MSAAPGAAAAAAIDTLHRFIVERVNVGIFTVGPRMEIRQWNRFMELNSGRREDDLLGKGLFECFPELPKSWLERKIRGVFILKNFAFISWKQRPYLFRFRHNRPLTGGVDYMAQDCTLLPVKDAAGEVQAVCITIFDATDVLLDVRKREELELELRHAQKLEAVGRLAGGIAHEINTPIQFISDNLHFMGEAMRDLAGLLKRYGELRGAVKSQKAAPAAAALLEEAEREIDLPYLLDNVPGAVERSIEGLNRVAAIVSSLKEFARPDVKDQTPSDLNQAIRNTLTVSRHEYSGVADVETDLAELPLVTCHPGEINEVLLSIIVNAAHTIADAVTGTAQRGKIRVRTSRSEAEVVIAISDTGGGIPEAIRDRIFDPFFTTKDVGRGSGQGLAIARSVIVDKHHGSLTFDTKLGQGTTFFIRLPA